MIASNSAVQLPPKSGRGSKPAWSSVEIDIMRRFYGSIPNKDLAAKLHRTVKAIENMARELKLTKSHERLREMGVENAEIRWRGPMK